MREVSKIILHLDDALLFAIKKVPSVPEKDRKLELPGGRLDEGEEPFDGLVRELAEEEKGAFIADKVASLQPTPVRIKVGGDRHYIYRMPISGNDLERFRMSPDEHYGHRLIHRSALMDPKRMKGLSLYTKRTVKIFSKLKKLGCFPYDLV